MGPFTEALVYALQNSTGDIQEVYELAVKKTAEISPGQEPGIYQSKTVRPVVLRRESQVVQDTRAKELLNNAEGAYRARAWQEFHAAVTRARALASDALLQQRLTNESDFAQAVMRAEAAETSLNWSEAATNWQKARDLFAIREWVGMKAAVAWLLADDLPRGVQALAVLGAGSDSELAVRARQMVTDLTKSVPALKAEADEAAHATNKIPGGVEFAKIQKEE
jgi:hypothetical protein